MKKAILMLCVLAVALSGLCICANADAPFLPAADGLDLTLQFCLTFAEGADRRQQLRTLLRQTDAIPAAYQQRETGLFLQRFHGIGHAGLGAAHLLGGLIETAGLHSRQQHIPLFDIHRITPQKNQLSNNLIAYIMNLF